MDRHHTNVSIAYAVLSVAGAYNQAPDATGHLSVGVLARAPGDGALAIARGLAGALGMATLEVRCATLEYHTGALSLGVGEPFEKAVATRKPVLVILDEAQSAEDGVLSAITAIISKRVEDRPVAVLAISTTAGERGVAERLAEGLGWDVGRVAMHRTDEEQRRLLEGVLATN